VNKNALTSLKYFDDTILEGIALIDFNAPWCDPCRAQDPIINDVQKAFNGKAVVAKVNIDENPKIAMDLGIQSIPTLILFKNGKEIERFVGLQAADTLNKALEKHL
jgi:thioredoxin 1